MCLYIDFSSIKNTAFPLSPDHSLSFRVLTVRNNAGPRDPRVLGLSPGIVLTNSNGTNLLWGDMRRTLAFAWEEHVFGSASFFILMAVLAVMGLAGACILPHPHCDALILANTLLILSGSLRGVLLLLDPYGTRQILSRATLAELHNAPLQLFLWVQLVFALITLSDKIITFPAKAAAPMAGWRFGYITLYSITCGRPFLYNFNPSSSSVATYPHSLAGFSHSVCESLASLSLIYIHFSGLLTSSVGSFTLDWEACKASNSSMRFLWVYELQPADV